MSTRDKIVALPAVIYGSGRSKPFPSLTYDGDFGGALLHLKKVYKIVSILGYIQNLGGHNPRQPLWFTTLWAGILG